MPFWPAGLIFSYYLSRTWVSHATGLPRLFYRSIWRHVNFNVLACHSLRPRVLRHNREKDILTPGDTSHFSDSLKTPHWPGWVFQLLFCSVAWPFLLHLISFDNFFSPLSQTSWIFRLEGKNCKTCHSYINPHFPDNPPLGLGGSPATLWWFLGRSSFQRSFVTLANLIENQFTDSYSESPLMI